MKSPLTSVYELTNSTMKESLIWIGDDGREPSGADLEARHSAHWSPADHVTVHTVESGLMRTAALEFRDRYVMNMKQLPGWSVRAVGPDS